MSVIHHQTLRQAITQYEQEGHQIAVVVIDEQGAAAQPQTPQQAQVLAHVAPLGLPVYFVELNPNPGAGANLPTRAPLAAAAPGAVVITKPHINAFASNVNPNFHTTLQGQGIRMLVMMGYSSQQCVKVSAVGGYDGPPHNPGIMRAGATGLGYTVLTSQLVLRGGQATWTHERGVRFYTAV
ncbi:MAG: isochorismatase family protein [Bacteroidota bacterium]